MFEDNHPDLRKIVNTYLGVDAGGASKTAFDKAKLEIISTKTALAKAIGHITMDKYLEIVGKDSPDVAQIVKDAVAMLDSYYIPLPSESINAGFARAKKESIAKLKSHASQLKYFSFKDYTVRKKKKAAAKKARSTNFDNVRVEIRKSVKSS
ncbi:hypothetical protein SAMN05660420_00832 [Desulfuromusa kysingii]|uniref:Uncharacterized protein n=1 Tax=Desulfuromusa kysingii TaxID=37625 RepID=A0A1H3X5B8_9BACT|nr:hypothetical protein [Desulfuromusa kysingii]SDZ94609.1 hypothetical protein SAMN05660420_00832 [Desulfuromusa kysingii]